jgi:hypothetical protein
VALFDRLGNRCNGAPFEVTADDYYERGTSAGGSIQVPRRAQNCHVRWGEPEQEGDEFAFSMDVHLDLASGDEQEDRRRALHNLGYSGDVDEASAAYREQAGLAEDDDVTAALLQQHAAGLSIPRGGSQ